ncbi:MAG: PD40 domain-containing protein, partial [Bacteroidia bacterium]|nr:PD40 domain-containing protein [Bacteroidia bacterium]
NLESGKKKRLFKSGPKLERLNDRSYPLLAWHPSGNFAGMITERKNQLILVTFDLENKEKFSRNITGFEKITDFSYSPDGKKLIFSAVKKGKGQSDIFVFAIASGGLEQLTSDIYDDLYARFVNNGKQIAFASNRSNDTLRSSDDAKYYYPMAKEMDIFMMDYPKKKNVLYRVTNTDYVNESQPIDFGNGYLSYLSEANGVRNNYIAKLDSVISFVDTTEHYRFIFTPKAISNYKRNTEYRDVNPKHDKITEIFFLNGKYNVYIQPLTDAENTKGWKLQNSYFRKNYTYLMKNTAYNNAVENQSEKITGLKNPDTTLTTSEIANSATESSIKRKNSNPYEPANFRIPIQQNYYINFSTDYIVTQLDNSFLSVQYQRFTGGGSPVYINPGLNALFKIGLSDVFEDYRIVGGIRFSSSLDNEYILSWENRKKMWDKQVILHRQGFVNVSNAGNGLMKVHTHDAQYKLKYPFSEVLAMKISFMYRNDRRTFLATNDENLNKPNQYDNMGSTKLEFIFDNTIKKGINLYNGFRGKIFGEYYRFVTKERHDLITFGFDFRHYQKIHRDLIWCNRIAGGGSLGTDRLVYYLGGIDNWMRPRFDNSINIVNPGQYQFQTLATNMRGFKQNIRNGN